MNLSAMFDSPQPQRITKTQLQTLMSGLSDAYMEAVLELEAPPTFYELTILFSRSIKDESRLLKTLQAVPFSQSNSKFSLYPAFICYVIRKMQIRNIDNPQQTQSARFGLVRKKPITLLIP